MSERRPLIIYRDVILALSETFIATPVPFLERYDAWYAGTRFRRHDLVDPSRVVVPSEFPAWRALLFKTARVIPREWIRRLRWLQPRLLHAQFGTDGVFAAPLAEKLGIPMVVTFFGFDATVSPSEGLVWRAYAHKRRKLYRTAARILTVSEFVRSRLIADGCPPDRVETHYTGVDTEVFRPDESVPRERTVLFVGRLVEKKGCADLIRAMARVQASAPDLRLVVIGDGPLRESLEQMAGETSNVTLLGPRPPAEVRSWMQRASIFALPSRTARSSDAEGLPFVVLEAQSAGLPVVSTRHAGIPEAILHGETGLLCDEGDVAAIAENVTRLANDESLRRRMGDAGRARVIAHFDLRRQTARLEHLYDSLC